MDIEMADNTEQGNRLMSMTLEESFDNPFAVYPDAPHTPPPPEPSVPFPSSPPSSRPLSPSIGTPNESQSVKAEVTTFLVLTLIFDFFCLPQNRMCGTSHKISLREELSAYKNETDITDLSEW